MYEIITGSHGFTGTNLTSYFLRHKKTVITLPRELLNSPVRLHKFLSQYQPFRLYNLASYGNLQGQNDIFEIYCSNVGKVLNLLEATDGLNCQAFITAGSTSEYGVTNLVMREDQMLYPTTFYSAAKAAATHLAQAWEIQYHKPVIIYRPSSITGVGEQDIHLIPVLIKSAIEGNEIDFDPFATHDFIDVLDVCSAISLLGENSEKCAGGIYNISSGASYSNQRVLEIVEGVIGKKVHIKGVMERKFESYRWEVDSNKMRSLDWEPKISLEKSVAAMVKAYAKRITT